MKRIIINAITVSLGIYLGGLIFQSANLDSLGVKPENSERLLGYSATRVLPGAVAGAVIGLIVAAVISDRRSESAIAQKYLLKQLNRADLPPSEADQISAVYGRISADRQTKNQ